MTDALRTRTIERWVTAVAGRIFALDKRIRAVVYALADDGGEVVEDFVPVLVAEPEWPGCLDRNPWADPDSAEQAELDEVLMDACEDYDSPTQDQMRLAFGAALPIGIDEPLFVPVAVADRAGLRLLALEDEEG